MLLWNSDTEPFKYIQNPLTVKNNLNVTSLREKKEELLEIQFQLLQILYWNGWRNVFNILSLISTWTKFSFDGDHQGREEITILKYESEIKYNH